MYDKDHSIIRGRNDVKLDNFYNFKIEEPFLLFSNIQYLVQESVARSEEFKKSVEAKMALRQSNMNPERPGE